MDGKIKGRFGFGMMRLPKIGDEIDVEQTKKMVDYFIENGKQTFAGAVGQQRISKEYVEGAYFPIPPIKEQERIVHQISMVFEYLNMISDALS